MTSATANKPFPIIHAAKVFINGQWIYLFLRKINNSDFLWYRAAENDKEEETEVKGINPEEAIRRAYRFWREDSIAMLNCGFRYMLPERDEHGINALFHQMIASYSSMNGVYFDEGAGNNCFINFASDEAKRLWKKLERQGRL